MYTSESTPPAVMNAMPPDEKCRPGGGAASQDPLAADHPKHNVSLDIIDTLAAAAIAYAEHHWPVLPLVGKIPAIPKRLGGAVYSTRPPTRRS